MTKTISQLSSYPQLKQLRTSLAISRGIKLMSVLQQEGATTISHDQSRRITYLTALFTRIHREVFHDWNEQATVSHRPGAISNANKRLDFRKTIGLLVSEPNLNTDTAIFDNNGFVIKTENIAERLADFYQKMRQVRPFNYGNRLTLDFFMVALGRLPTFRGVYEQGIDLRRLNLNDKTILHDPNSSFRELTRVFECSLDPNLNTDLNNCANGYGHWPENKKLIAGMPFLSHKTALGIDCLVTVNGGLIPIEKIEISLFLGGKHLADYPLISPENIIGYLPSTESLRSPDKTEIDGIAVDKNGSAPLFCLDCNLLTGLLSSSHAELLELIQQYAGDKVDVYDLANNKPLFSRLLLAAHNDSRLQRSVEIAYQRLTKMTAKLESAKLAIFADKTAVSKPKFFMSMGGAGSGKSAVEDIAKAQCQENFIIASLDAFRIQSDLYQILTAANHHSDDYVYVEPFAKRLRDLVAAHALANNFNILYDGTGIPFNPRYAQLIKKFKRAGFNTQITAVDAYMVIPTELLDKTTGQSIFTRVKNRFDQTQRALPWVITIDKHIRSPKSFVNALEHPQLDKISLFGNEGGKDQHYLVAESFAVTDADIGTLHEQQLAGTLSGHLKSMMRNRDDSVLRILSQNSDDTIASLAAKNRGFKEKNVAYLIYVSEFGQRVLVIYNIRRLVDFINKRQLNPYASGPDGLRHRRELLSFIVEI
jgi:fido (protein-threonine AMPylation protein)